MKQFQLPFPLDTASAVSLFPSFSMMDPVQKAVMHHTFGVHPLKRRHVSCSVCQLRFNSQSQAVAHYKGTKHAKKLKSLEATKCKLKGTVVTKETTNQEVPKSINPPAMCYSTGRKGRGFRLTKDHSTSNPKERKRILQSGGAISVNKQHGLVEGLTEATRGLGHYGDRKLKKSVIPVPYSVSLPTDPSFQMLVLASSGLWEVLDEHAVAERALTVIELTQQKLIVKTLCLMQTVEDSSVSDSQSCIQSRPGSSIFDSEEPSSVKDEDNPPELDMPEPLGVQARDIQNIEETERHQSLVLQQESEVNVKGTMADSLKNLTLDYERLAADICRELVDTALVSGSRENISVMVILLHGLDVLRENTLKGELTKQTNTM
ncbi:unnamed protein product [Oncorhynchus mykiss]|uniref:PPM-type phosphatase domain-containing protein n=1 Tax=Oncorhynchus mykiss TaxID=8022 RepID=A0A060VYE1_ONCMY|nr:unnamed protein product [Oncorhynchus mykiss]